VPRRTHRDGVDLRRSVADYSVGHALAGHRAGGKAVRSGGERPVSDAGQPQSYTVRLELADEPGELLRALQPIADHGGNLLSIYHERGDVTPRGRVPVEVDLECPPERFDEIVAALRDAEVGLVQAGQEQYGEEVTVLLVGHLVDTDLSETLDSVEASGGVSVADVALSASEGTDAPSSALLRLAVARGGTATALDAVRDVADRKDLRVVEPLQAGDGVARPDGGVPGGDLA
jgi:ACT domain-containing protein